MKKFLIRRKSDRRIVGRIEWKEGVKEISLDTPVQKIEEMLSDVKAGFWTMEGGHDEEKGIYWDRIVTVAEVGTDKYWELLKNVLDINDYILEEE